MRLIERYWDILASIYIYNEYTGYTELEKLLEAIRAWYPGETEFITAVEKHTEDERKHYRMFRSYFQQTGRMPYVVNRTYGYVDLFIRKVFGKFADELEPMELMQDKQSFFRLCRLIMMTEFRGMKQVKVLLANRRIQKNDALMKIFTIVERDEPSHCYPYQHWLQTQGSHQPNFRERFTDAWIHYSIILVKGPLLFLNWRLRRMGEFYA